MVAHASRGVTRSVIHDHLAVQELQPVAVPHRRVGDRRGDRHAGERRQVLVGGVEHGLGVRVQVDRGPGRGHDLGQGGNVIGVGMGLEDRAERVAAGLELAEKLLGLGAGVHQERLAARLVERDPGVRLIRPDRVAAYRQHRGTAGLGRGCMERWNIVGPEVACGAVSGWPSRLPGVALDRRLMPSVPPGVRSRVPSDLSKGLR